MDFVFIALGGLIWLVAYGLAQACARLQAPEAQS
jgi:hypothetical protein